MADEGRFIDPDTLTYKEEKIGDVVVEVATIDVGAFEARISRWPAGSQVPRHAHSTEIITVLLRGKARSSGRQEMRPGILYDCGGFEYGPWFVEERATFLTFQPKGSKIVMPQSK